MMMQHSFVLNVGQAYVQELMNHDVTNAGELKMNVSGFLTAEQLSDW
jgi:hypothetical protein